jgi:TATA-box binding protein (TBP) (component of TFIID and TFIIIB)
MDCTATQNLKPTKARRMSTTSSQYEDEEEFTNNNNTPLNIDDIMGVECFDRLFEQDNENEQLPPPPPPQPALQQQTNIKPIEYTLVNTVRVLTLNQRINLKKLTDTSKNIAYNVPKFPVFTMFFRKGSFDTLARIFASGKINIFAANDTEEANFVKRDVIRRIRKSHGNSVRAISYRIANLVYNVKIPYKLILLNAYHMLYRHYTIHVNIEELDFQNLIIKANNEEFGKYSILIYSTGKLVVSGLKNPNHIFKVIENLMKILDQNREYIEDTQVDEPPRIKRKFVFKDGRKRDPPGKKNKTLRAPSSSSSSSSSFE